MRIAELMENLKVKDQENNELRSSSAVNIREKAEIKMQLSSARIGSQNQPEFEALKRQVIELNDAKNEAQTLARRIEAKATQTEI